MPDVVNSFAHLQMRWQFMPSLFTRVARAVLVAVLMASAFGLFILWPVVDATAASVLVAVVFGLFTFRQQALSQIRQHTVELLTQFQTADRLVDADRWMALRIKSGEPIGPEIDGEADEQVITLLDYYEFLAVLARRGQIHAGLLNELRGGAIVRTFEVCLPYIYGRRQTTANDLYSGLESFAMESRRRAELAARVVKH